MGVGAERDYYAILGVPETAAEEEIKRAYRRLALRHHPDRNRGDRRAEERFKELSEAYAVLMDPARRRDYDRARRARAAGGAAREPGWRPGWREEELFRDLFTDPRTATVFDELGREWSRMGFRFNEAFLRDLFFGGRAVIIVTPGGIRWIGATGRRAGVEPLGADMAPPGEPVLPRSGILAWLWGRAKEALSGPLDALRRALALPARGTRRGDLTYEIWLDRPELASGGRYRLTIERAGRTEELLVRIPPGLRPHTRLRLRGRGEPGSDGKSGDLYLRVRAKD